MDKDKTLSLLPAALFVLVRDRRVRDRPVEVAAGGLLAQDLPGNHFRVLTGLDLRAAK